MLDTYEILTPESPRWHQFVDDLCKAMRISDGECRCDGDSGPYTYRYAKRVLTEMRDVSIPATLAYLDNGGTFCDCSILDMKAGKLALHTGAMTIRRIAIPFFCVQSHADLERHRNVHIEWVVSQRPTPLFGPSGSTELEYRHIIDYYDDDDGLNNAWSRKGHEMCADELFTADEAKAFVAWMRTRRKIQATMSACELPIFDTFALAWRDGMEVGFHRLSISDDPDYDLPFRTTGYWSELPIGGHQPWHRM